MRSGELRDLDTDFHRAIWHECGNARLAQVTDNLGGQSRLAWQWQVAGGVQRALREPPHTMLGTMLDKDVEAPLWQRFSKARNGVDKARRAHFAKLEQSRGEIKAHKEELVAEAEAPAREAAGE